MNPPSAPAPDPRRRFSDRVEYYVRYRPGYPHEVVDFLGERAGLTREAVVADLGSGTGISARLFLENDNRVYGVEPNREMREAAEKFLSNYSNFISVDGAAESTNLPDHTVDFIVAAQAFHWFDRPRAGRESARILKPAGHAVLLWNERMTEASPFLHGFEQLLLDCSTDYAKINHAYLERKDIAEFYGNDEFGEAHFSNRQVFDFESLRGRVYSASYVPLPGSPHHDAMMRRLRELFERFNENGSVAFEYDTRLYYGTVSAGG